MTDDEASHDEEVAMISPSPAKGHGFRLISMPHTHEVPAEWRGFAPRVSSAYRESHGRSLATFVTV